MSTDFLSCGFTPTDNDACIGFSKTPIFSLSLQSDISLLEYSAHHLGVRRLNDVATRIRRLKFFFYRPCAYPIKRFVMTPGTSSNGCRSKINQFDQVWSYEFGSV